MPREWDIDKLDKNTNPEALFTLISFILSIVSLLLTGWQVATPTLPPLMIVLKDFMIFLTLLILVGFFFLRYRQVLNAKKRQQDSLEKQLEWIRTLITSQVDVYHKLMSQTREAVLHEVRPVIYPHRYDYRTEGLNVLLKDTLNTVVTGLRSIAVNELEARFGAPAKKISISVKALVTGRMAKKLCQLADAEIRRLRDDELYVITLHRDNDTRTANPDREIRRRVYDIKDNTVFVRIHSEEGMDFLENNLHEAFDKKNFRNQNEEWEKYYNSTLVVPIWHREPTLPKPLIFGFLTIDSKERPPNGELFTREQTKPIMLFGADLLALVLLTLDMYDQLPDHLRNPVQ